MSAQPIPPAGPPPESELLALLYWCARWQAGGASFYRGRLTVEITAGRKSLTLRPGAGDERYGPADGPGAADGLTAAAMLRVMFSEDERTILEAVTERKATTGADVVKASGIERARCYELLRNLKERGVLRDTPDGIELVAAAVWRACAAGG